MKKVKILLSSSLVVMMFFLSQTTANACRQSHIPCEGNDPGVYLICRAPASGTCYAGGCGSHIIIVTCPDGGHQ